MKMSMILFGREVNERMERAKYIEKLEAELKEVRAANELLRQRIEILEKRIKKEPGSDLLVASPASPW